MMKHTEWLGRYTRLRTIAERIDRMRTERGFALAATVGIPHDMCCLHNASIDDGMTGWCNQNPRRLKVARHAKRIIESSGDGYRIVTQWDRRVRGY